MIHRAGVKMASLVVGPLLRSLMLTEGSQNLLNNISLYRNRVDLDAQQNAARHARELNAFPRMAGA